MKPLLFPFQRDGFTHELIKREGRVALVGRHKKGRSRNLEVVVIRDGKPNRFIPYPYEKYPSSEDWGTYGFTFKADQHDRALARFNLLTQKYG